MVKMTPEDFERLAELKISQKTVDESRRIIDMRFKLIKATYKQTAAQQKFNDWCGEMIKQYGDGESVRIVNIPAIEARRGAKLEKAYSTANDTMERVEAEIHKQIEAEGIDA